MTEVDFPYHVDGRGRPAGTSDDDHLRDLIEQVLLTAPGERVMRPGFGAGLARLVFEPNGPGLGAATRHLVEAALQRELGDRIAVQDLEVTQDEGTLSVELSYVALRTQTPFTITITGIEP
jgi:phage baseplate assembly protein W